MHFAEKYINLISESIEKYKFEEAPFELYQPINYIIANGGKRLRPMLTLMAADAFEGYKHRNKTSSSNRVFS